MTIPKSKAPSSKVTKRSRRAFSVSYVDDRTAAAKRRTPLKANPPQRTDSRPFANQVPTTQTTKPNKDGRRTPTSPPSVTGSRLTAGPNRRRRR